MPALVAGLAAEETDLAGLEGSHKGEMVQEGSLVEEDTSLEAVHRTVLEDSPRDLGDLHDPIRSAVVDRTEEDMVERKGVHLADLVVVAEGDRLVDVGRVEIGD